MIAIVEIPKGSSYKYELKHDVLILDRVLSIPYPENYGYIPNTLWYDGDPLDVFIISNEPIQPKAHLEIELLGIIEMNDNGQSDDKLIAKIKGTDVYSHVGDIYTFLENYKSGVFLKKIKGPKEALETLKLAEEMYLKGGHES
mgnify:CR=1 FL=1